MKVKSGKKAWSSSSLAVDRSYAENGINLGQNSVWGPVSRYATWGITRLNPIGTMRKPLEVRRLYIFPTYNICLEFKSSVIAARFHPSGRLLATGSTDKVFKIWTCYIDSADDDNEYDGPYKDIESFGKCLKVIKGNHSWINAVAFSPEGNFVAFAGIFINFI